MYVLIKWLWIAVLLLATFITGIVRFSLNAAYVETFYSSKLFPFFAFMGQGMFNNIPFSVGDIFYLLMICIFIVQLGIVVRFGLKKKWLQLYAASLSTAVLIMTIVVAFYLLWGLNYFRNPLWKRMDLKVEDKYYRCELLETTVWCLEEANRTKRLYAEANDELADRAIHKIAERLMKEQNGIEGLLYVGKPKIKRPLANWWTDYFLVSGYFNPFTQEAHVNSGMPIWIKPFTSCHELSHQAGIGFEDEANFIAFLLASQAKEALFQYSAYYSALTILLSEIYMESPDLYKSFVKLIDPLVWQDIQSERVYWRQYDGLINTLSTTFYGGYLQLNNQPEGLRRYNMMTRFLIAWHNQSKSA